MRLSRGFLIFATFAAAQVWGGTAQAQQFEALARKAVRIDRAADLAALFWASTVDCAATAGCSARPSKNTTLPRAVDSRTASSEASDRAG